MDFTLTPEAIDAAALAKTILADHCTPDRLREIDRGDGRFDADLWHVLGDAGLLGLALPEEYGGSGLGMLEQCAVLVEAGRVLAPVPLAEHGAAAMTLAEFGDGAVSASWLPRAATGDAVLTAATDPDRDGRFGVVPAGTIADALLFSAGDADDLSVRLLPADQPGLVREPQTISDGDLTARITIDPAVLAGASSLGGADVLDRLRERLDLARVAHQLGVVEGALDLTAGYARTRQQFGRPIGTFQAVSQRLADGYIDVLGARLTMWQAAWRLAEGLPCATEVAQAKLWAADAGHRLAHTAVHVHGGVGIDLDGEAHRYFTAAKRGEFLLGGTTAAARTIGALLAG